MEFKDSTSLIPTHLSAVASVLLGAAIVLVPSCSPVEKPLSQGAASPVTNRLDVPPEVVNNLGITWEKATRGRLGVWREVPGQLEVPESRRWTLRSPARARLVSVVPRWRAVEKGSEIAVLTSPELREAQRTIEFAQRTLDRARKEVVAARARLGDSKAHLADAKSFEAASRSRLVELEALHERGNALTIHEFIEARRTVTDAGKASLDAAITRDQLVSMVATKQLEADQALLSVDERLNGLAVLTGLSVQELTETIGKEPTWRTIDSLTVRAPAPGVVVELLAAHGETLETGAPIVRVFDTSELRFRGHLPEGDLGTLSAGNPVRLEFPSRQLRPIETVLNAPLPVADIETRMIHVEAVVANDSGILAHGISVMAHVLEMESAHEEVLIPSRCVVFDGLEAIVFRRDPDDPNVVIRTPVELGSRAAGQVEVFAGVLDGDAVVADGIHQLKRTGLGKPPLGVHVHADGTWHADHK